MQVDSKMASPVKMDGGPAPAAPYGLPTLGALSKLKSFSVCQVWEDFIDS